MTTWRPAKSIKFKVVGLPIQDGRLLVADVPMDDGRIKGVRPLGGSIEFGETREEALAREFQEELGTRIKITGPWLVFENIYQHEDALGHEMVFAAEIELLDTALYERDDIIFSESDGNQCRARWFGRPALRASGLEIFPAGLGDWFAGKL